MKGLEEAIRMMNMSLATVMLLEQKASSQERLAALFNQAAQLLTLSTGAAAIFAAFE
jgi:hypothetical protein